ncbi:MAG: S8 family serine peptidase [Verrucomicrobia bacterium]|nr:S8 family serine peptidase [Verrucomicrobiota bacterium]
MLPMLGLALQASAAPSETVHHSPVRLSGHVPAKAVSESVFLKSLDANAHVPLTFILPLRNKAALEELVNRIYDPNDELYGKYLTTEEFVEQFAPAQEDYDHVVAYVNSLGLTVTGTHSNRTLLNVSGPAEAVEKAFNLRLHHYQKSNGRTFYAPDNDPEVPGSVGVRIHGIVGLDNHAVWHSYIRPKKTAEGFLTTEAASHAHPSGPAGGYSPSDIITAYDLTGVSANGSGQIIAMFELGKYQASDINEYTKYFGLPQAKLTNILVDGGAGGGIDAEVTLDIELALALAPESQIYVYEGPNTDQGVLDTYNRIATDNIAKQVSTSWGMGEDGVNPQYFQAENAIFMQMAAHGQTIYAAAGDSGAYDDSSSQSLVVDDPASQPYVVAVGGTKLTVNSSSGAYGDESVWNEGAGQGAGGGGVSSYWPLPSWQTNVSTLYSKTHRNVPDVALNADPNTGYSIFYNGQWTTYGGTSCAAPLWAAFTACINQQRVASQKAVLGFANPLLYAIGAGSSYLANFHDITTGDNLYYSAGKGYDNATGWGSFIGANLFASLTGSLTPPPPPQLLPRLNVLMKHNAPFTAGGTGTYKIVVSNHGNASTSGAVTVSIALPNGLTYSSLSGSGWTFDSASLTCTQNNTLTAGSHYPTITLIVDVDPNAPRTVIPTATVSGGGAASGQTTTNLTTVR